MTRALLDPERRDRLEELLLSWEPDHSRQGWEMLTTLLPPERLALAGMVLRPWATPSRQQRTDIRCRGPRMRSAAVLCDIERSLELSARGAVLYPPLSPDEEDAFHAVQAHPVRRLLSPREVEALVVLCPHSAVYLRTCTKGGWRRGALLEALLGVCHEG